MDSSSPSQLPQASIFSLPPTTGAIKQPAYDSPSYPYHLDDVPRQADVIRDARYSTPTRPRSAIARSSKSSICEHQSDQEYRISRPSHSGTSPHGAGRPGYAVAAQSSGLGSPSSPQSLRDSVTLANGKPEPLAHGPPHNPWTPDRRLSTSRPISNAPPIHSSYAVSLASSEESEKPSARQTMRSLLYIALPALPLSLAFCLYTIFAICLITLLAPLRLCFKALPTFNRRLLHILVPPLNFQRRCIYQPQLASASPRASASSRTPLSSNESGRDRAIYPATASAGPLITTHVLAPLIALPLAVCAWVMGTAWALGAMVSDEEAGDDRDERRIAERIVGWWASWLDYSMPEDDLEAPRPARGRRKVEMTQHRGGEMASV